MVFPIPKMRYQRDKDKLSDGPEKQKNIHMNVCPGCISKLEETIERVISGFIPAQRSLKKV